MRAAFSFPAIGLFLLTVHEVPASAAEPSRPNVVVIMTDDKCQPRGTGLHKTAEIHRKYCEIAVPVENQNRDRLR